MKLAAPLLAFALAVAPMAHAGGPVVIEEESQPEVIAEKPASSVGILPILLGVVVLCVVLCGDSNDDPVREQPPPG